MPRADLKITLTGLTPTLRADAIRHATLVQLAYALRQGDDRATDLQNALDRLIDAVESPHDDEGAEIDALVGDIESHAEMGPAEIELSRGDLRQLAREAADAVNALTPKSVPQQTRGAA